MERDFDLIRKILTSAEAQPAGQPLNELSYPGEYDDEVVAEHIERIAFIRRAAEFESRRGLGRGG